MAEDERPKQSEQPKSVCATCFGAGKVFTFTLVNGRTREVWMSCPACNAPVEPVSGP